VVHLNDPVSVSRIAKIAPPQIKEMLLLFPECKKVRVGWTYIVEGQEGRLTQHVGIKTESESHCHWIVLFRVRGRAKPGRNNSPEALVRASVTVLAELGLHTVPPGRFDSAFSAVHGALGYLGNREFRRRITVGEDSHWQLRGIW
jgi:hypothetical protein